MKPLIIAALLTTVSAAAAAQEARGIWGPNKHEAMIQPVVRSPELPESQRVTLTCAVPAPAAGQVETSDCTFMREAIPEAFDASARETLITCMSYRSPYLPADAPSSVACGFYLDGKTPRERTIPGSPHPPLPNKLYTVRKPF